MRVYLLRSMYDGIDYDYFVKLTFRDYTRILFPCLNNSEANLINHIVDKNYEGIDILKTKEGIEYPTSQISHSLKFSSKKDLENWLNNGQLYNVTFV